MALVGRELAALEKPVLFTDELLDVREYGCILVRLGHGLLLGVAPNIALRGVA